MNWLASGCLLSCGLMFGACGDDSASGGGTTTNTTGSGGAGGAAVTGLSIPGLSAPVNATYDQAGILHLSCGTDNDCFAALGYFHAQNRFFFMDFIRNLVRGKLGALVKAGPLVLTRDYENRRFFTTPAGLPLEEKLYADASLEVKGHFDAYARGVNAWIGDMRGGQNGATLTTEYDFNLIDKTSIRDWEAADSAAVGLYVLNDLSNNSGSELALGVEVPAFDPPFAADLFSSRFAFHATTTSNPLGVAPGGDFGGPAKSNPAARALLARAHESMLAVGSGQNARMPGDSGSNNWVVGPSKSSTGNALLANDPHLPLTNPSIWFAVEIDAKSAGTGNYHMAGSTFPGLPAMMVGHNESIGWGVTTAYYDLADVYVETLTPDGSKVMLGGNEVAILDKEFSFYDSSTGTTITQTFRYVPHHGPIISQDLAAQTAVSVRWTGHDGGTDLDAFFALGRASSMAEAKTGLQMASAANQNFVVVDKAGGFGWFPLANVPNRPWASLATPPWMPLDGAGTAQWAGYVPKNQLPQLENPAAGYIATANQDLTGAGADGDPTNDGQAAIQALSKADGTRQRRILDLLAQGNTTHTVETMVAIQGDAWSLYGEVITPIVLAAMQGQTMTPEEQALVDALSVWNFSCPTGVNGTDPVMSPDDTDATAAQESIGCTAFHATLNALTVEALGDEIAAAGVELKSGRWDVQLVLRALRDPASIQTGDLMWDDVSSMGMVETRDDIIRRAVSVAADRLAITGSANDWRWGRLHTLSLRSIFDNFGVPTYNDGPYAAAGGFQTVNVANPLSRAVPAAGTPFDFAFSSGASVRFVVEARPEGPRMVYQLPGGNDLHRESPFYNNLLDGWLSNTPIEFPFGPGAVTNPSVSLTVSPRP